MKYKRRITVALIMLTYSLSLYGCNTSGTEMLFQGETASTEYYAENAMPAHEYAVFLSKHVTTDINQTISVISSIRTRQNCQSTHEELITAIETAENIMQASKKDVKFTKPAAGYDSNRDKYLYLNEQIINKFEESRTASEADDLETLGSIVVSLEASATSLSALSTVNYQ